MTVINGYGWLVPVINNYETFSLIIIIIIIKYETHQSRCSSTNKREKYRGMAKKEN